jgi:hypothetical protein
MTSDGATVVGAEPPRGSDERPVEARSRAEAHIGGARADFRAHTLDGAMLYFHPPTGTHVRVQTEGTRHLRRQAPRVVLFGVTNACNLACGFCSRDRGAPSLWTLPEAADVLRGLAAAGTLEVAFGGGEPFAFRGFSELIQELHVDTPLALHVTTNGGLLPRLSWDGFRGRLGQVQLSIYPDQDWRGAAEVLSREGQRWGANLLVDRAALETLEDRLVDLAERGCEEVTFLRYVGPEAERRLSIDDRARLRGAILAGPLPARISACFGDTLGLPRWLGTPDCGAGLDFVTLTGDKRLESCSFQGAGVRIETAEDVLRAWREDRARWGQPSPRAGCARAEGAFDPPPAVPTSHAPLTTWRAFAANNSGDSVLVAKFQTIDDAEDFIATALGGYADVLEGRSPPWAELMPERFGAAVVPETPWDTSPRDLGRVGTTVLAFEYAPCDAFPELRALAWSRGARVLGGGTHVHEPICLLVGVRTQGEADAQALVARAMLPTLRHRSFLLFAVPLQGEREDVGLSSEDEDPETFEDPHLPSAWFAQQRLADFLDDRPCVAEVFPGEVTSEALARVADGLARSARRRPRGVLTFFRMDPGPWSPEQDALVEALGQVFAPHAAHVGRHVLVDPLERPQPFALQGHAWGADVDLFEGESLQLGAHLTYRVEPHRTRTLLEVEVTAAALRQRLSPLGPTHLERRERAFVVTLVTAMPGPHAQALAAAATELGLEATLWFDEVDPLDLAVRRLAGELLALERRARQARTAARVARGTRSRR